MSLFYSNKFRIQLNGYTDVRYMFYRYKARSHSHMVEQLHHKGLQNEQKLLLYQIMQNTRNSWCKLRISLAKIHYLSCPKDVIYHQRIYTPVIFYEDNIAYVTQLKWGYIKGDRTKHISPKFFFTHDLQKIILQIYFRRFCLR